MRIRLQKARALLEKGKRKNNEDAIFVGDQHAAERLFIVCDGVGGASKGEVASALACQTFAQIYKNAPDGAGQQPFFWEQTLQQTEAAFTQQIEANSSCKGMATTLVMVHFSPKGALVAWSGDSRLYQIRENKIIYRTTDHSLVAKMVADGNISAEEAETHPQKNIILRAINGKHRPTELEFHQITDIQAGDQFLLCSDGIVDGLSDEKLLQIFEFGEQEYDFTLEQLDAFCAEYSNDNYSCILIPVEEVAILDSLMQQPDSTNQATDENQAIDVLKWLKIGVIPLILLLVGFFTFNFFSSKSEIALAEKRLAKAESFIADSSFQLAGIELSQLPPNFEPEKVSALQEKVDLVISKQEQEEEERTLFGLNMDATEIEIDERFANDSTFTILEADFMRNLTAGRFFFSFKKPAKAFEYLKNTEKSEFASTIFEQSDWKRMLDLYLQEAEKDSIWRENANFVQAKMDSLTQLKVDTSKNKLATDGR